MNVTYKIGLVYCKAGQKTEEEMYNNGELITFSDFRHFNVVLVTLRVINLHFSML